jgi:hypothetical protein
VTCPLHFTHPDGHPEVCAAPLTLDRGTPGRVSAVCLVHGFVWGYITSRP